MKKLKLFSAAFIAMALMFGTTYAQYVTTTIFEENMGSTTTTTAIENNVFQNTTIGFYGTNTSIRATSASTTTALSYYPTASGTANVFMGTSNICEFGFGYVNTNGYVNLELSFGLRKGSTATSFSDIEVSYSTDATNWTPISITKWERWKNGIADSLYASGTAMDFPTETGSTGWYYLTCEADSNNIPATSTLYIKFNKVTSGNGEIRIDDIKLTGDMPVPYINVNEPVDGAVYGICDSIFLDIDVQNFALMSVNPLTPGEGYVKLESEVIDSIAAQMQLPVSSPVYCNDMIMGMISNIGGFVLPEGQYTLTASLVDKDSVLIDSLTQTITFSVVADVVETPTFTPEAGAYHLPQTIEIACATDGAEIYYTTDGTEPSNENGTLYTEPIELNDTLTIKAIAYAECALESEIAEATFTKDVTGINDFAASSVAISPNPATSVLNVSANGYNSIDIVNFLGQVVYSSNLSNSTIQINVNDLNSGVYFVRLKNENNTITRKFIKK